MGSSLVGELAAPRVAGFIWNMKTAPEGAGFLLAKTELRDEIGVALTVLVTEIVE
jgi:hypothetical protein